MAKMLLCALLVIGMFPGSDELVETVVHLAHDGHMPHSEAHDLVAATEGCGDSDEHGCTPLAHHCQCCVSLSAVPPSVPDFGALARLPGQEKHGSLQERGPPNAALKPFLRPPIS